MKDATPALLLTALGIAFFVFIGLGTIGQNARNEANRLQFMSLCIERQTAAECSAAWEENP